ncbi:MAG: DUF3014 domain-containing protein, partial [Desulfuromonadales bacterium]
MKAARFLIVIVAAVALGAVLARWYWPGPEQEPEQETSRVADSISEAERTPVPKVRHPVVEKSEKAEPDEKPEETLPSLEQSDSYLRDALGKLLPERRLEDTLILKNLIGRVVLMVDALPRETLPMSRLPVRQAEGDFLVEKRAEGLFLSPENFRRYTPYMRLVEAVDIESAVALYARYYPLFQQSYEALGYPDRYFNDRLIQVIDHLLDGPDPELPVRLVQPKVRYRYADPDLESLSAGRKILIRIGPDNAAVLKNRLRET